jgi:hypothetical protein
MNTLDLSYSTSTPATTAIEAEQNLYDFTVVNLNVSQISERVIPLYMTINWGDGNIEYFDNTLYRNYREESIFNEVLYNIRSSVLLDVHSHTYYPSVSARFKQLSAEIFIEYTDGSVCSIVQPFRITSGDYFETIGDMKHLKTNILPTASNEKQFVFSVDRGGFLIESES